MVNRRFAIVALVTALVLGGSAVYGAASLDGGAVFTMSNAAAANEIVAFARDGSGALAFEGAFPTGGFGTGGGLGNQSGLALSDNGRWLVVVNAGSDDVSLFRVRPHSLDLADRISSFGTRPISITEVRGLVYVLNAGSLTVAGFEIRRGALVPIPGSVRAVGGRGIDPAQIGLTTDGRVLVVTLKDSNEIVTYPLDGNRVPGDPVVTASNGATPFGFGLAREMKLFVSEAAGGAPGASSLSSYVVGAQASLHTLTPSLPTHQTAACWVAISPNGRLAYTSNTPAATLTGFRIGPDGALALLDPSGVTATTGAGSAPVDSAFSRNGRYLYTLNSGSHQIGIFGVRPDGSLVPIGQGPSVPVAANGLAAR